MKNNIRTLLLSILLLGVNISAESIDYKRVACVGNSITYGYGLTTAQNYPTKLQTLLGANYAVRNYGVSSRTMLKNGDYPYWNEAKFTDAKALVNITNTVDDYVVIELGTNDIKTYNWARPGANFEGDYKEMISIFRSLNSKPEIWLNLLPPGNNPGWDILQTNIVNNGNTAIKKIALETGTGLIDLFEAFNGSTTTWYNTTMYLTDKVHPADAGATLIAQKVYEMLSMQKPELTHVGAKITAPSAFGYQWYFNGTPILAANGGTNQDYTALEVGNYKVSLKLNANNETRIVSKELSITSLVANVHKVTEQNAIKIYPNPSKNNLITVEVSNSIHKKSVIYAFNEIGKLVLSMKMQNEKETIDISAFAKGTYLFKIETDGKCFSTKIISSI